jgi:eukaryotic-like serine/threonine-protein kinase
MTGSGLSITFPVPDGWTIARSTTPDLSRTDAAVGADVLLRVDLTAGGTGTARSATEGLEADLAPGRPSYTRLDIADVAGAGDDAVDWTFTYDLDPGRPTRVIDRMIRSGPGAIAVYLRAPAELYDRYLPVWQRTTRDLTIRTS